MTADVKIFASHVEQSCLDQIEKVASCEAFADAKIRIMPDCHSGKGCVIGFTANNMSKAVPNLVGVDIGCGMYAAKLSDRITGFEKFDKAVREVVPMGFEVNDRRMFSLSSDYDFYATQNFKTKKGLSDLLERLEAEITL